MRNWSQEEEAQRLAERFSGISQAAFAREHGVPGGASMLSQHIKGRRPINLPAALAYARGFGVPLEEISPRLAAQANEAERIGKGIFQPGQAAKPAHEGASSPDSLDGPTVNQPPPIAVAWEEIMNDSTEEFRTRAPDNALAPRLVAGQRFTVQRGLQPRGGDGVLVRDAAGVLHMRLYSPGAGGRWAAVAENPAFQALDSERDGLSVVGVLTSVDGRWG